jgi:hypothetical protein
MERIARRTARLRHQTGAGAVEMALALVVLVVIVFGFIDMARWLYAWNIATEATRAGARLAAICSRSPDSAEAIRRRMLAWLPELSQAQAQSVIRIDYLDAGAQVSSTCSASDCAQVSVWLSDYGISGVGGILSSGVLPLPNVRSTVARESLDVRDGPCNPSTGGN